MSRVYDIASAYVDSLAALHPIAATSMGVPGHDDKMTDFSPDGAEARAALSRDTAALLRQAPLEGERDRVARDTMLDQLTLDLELHDAGEELRDINILASPLQGMRRCFDLMSTDSAEAWRNIASRMGEMPAALTGYRRTLEEGLRRGKPGTQRQAAACAMQAQVWSGGQGGESFFSRFIGAYDATGIGDAALRADLEGGSRAASEAYAAFGRFLKEDYAPAAEPRDPVGRDRYTLGVRVYNGISLDLEATYAWGWDELYRIEREMTETAERILPGAGVEAAKQLLEADPARAIEGVDAFQRWMQDIQDGTIAALNGKHFDIPGPVRTIEAMIAPPGGALAMYYTGPSEDFSRPGRTWYPTAGKTRFPLWGEVSIAYHEGVPGHHLQIAQVMYLSDELSRFQRLLGGTSGYAEGWALYAERLMAELGYLENPDYYLGMLRAQALRCARVVADIGMHLELAIPKGERFHPGETWTPELAQAFMVERSHFPADFLASEVDRYLGIPGQAISYKVGERVWLAARQRVREAQGVAFDLKGFHAYMLNLGPMGLAQLEESAARYGK